MRYREPLPAGCPPPAADRIDEPRIVFRLVRTDPPTENDFRSQRAERGPDRVFHGVDECRARGVSVYSERDTAESVRQYRSQRGRMLCHIRLDRGAGSIQQTGEHAHHHTWWPLARFDIVAASQVEP